MLRNLLTQLTTGALTLLVVVVLTFFLIRLLPGGPFDQDRKLPPAIQANIEAKYHLDKPVWQQLGYYLGDLARGDLGPSYKFVTRSVNDIVAQAAGVSFSLGLMALVVGMGAGTLLGSIAGFTRNRWLAESLTLLGVSSISVPAFIFGAVLVLIFAYTLGWLPAARLTHLPHWILPTLTLSLTPFAYTFMLIKTTVQKLTPETFVQIKRAYGLSEKRIIFVHILKNALLPLISIAGPIAAALVTGSFAVELIFAVPGLGKYFVSGVINRDYTLVMGITLLYSATLIAFNTLTDMLYGWVDPRLKNVGQTNNGS